MGCFSKAAQSCSTTSAKLRSHAVLLQLSCAVMYYYFKYWSSTTRLRSLAWSSTTWLRSFAEAACVNNTLVTKNSYLKFQWKMRKIEEPLLSYYWYLGWTSADTFEKKISRYIFKATERILLLRKTTISMPARRLLPFYSLWRHFQKISCFLSTVKKAPARHLLKRLLTS